MFCQERAAVDRKVMDRAHGPGGPFDVAFDQGGVVGIGRYIPGGGHTFYFGKQDQVLAVTFFETKNCWNVQLPIEPFENGSFALQIGGAAGRGYFQIGRKLRQVPGLSP